MQTDTFNNNGIVPHDQFVAQMEQDRRVRYAKGTAALIMVAATLVFVGYAITQLAGGAAVFAN